MLDFIKHIAPILSLLTSLANLGLAIFVYKFSKRKNDTDRNVKWFQELVFTPNKDLLFAYFKNLSALREKIPKSSDLNEEQKINLMDLVKTERSRLMYGFVDIIRPIVPPVYDSISKEIDELTDSLTKAIDNDELKLNNERTFAREIENRISSSRNKILIALFNYAG